MEENYHRYHIETKNVANIEPHPCRFNVKVNRFALAKLLVKEFVHFKGNLPVVKSRPCVYGVFSGPIGGFAPREKLCVGCLRCTTQYPDVVQIYRNPKRKELGDSFFTPDYVDTVTHEAESGRIPIRGAGYPGKFGGTGWDGMWTDMSEIVRPTRDGIHGREYISLQVDIGSRPAHLTFDAYGKPIGAIPQTLAVQVPILLDLPPERLETNINLCNVFGASASELKTFAILPVASILKLEKQGSHLAPAVDLSNINSLGSLKYDVAAIELLKWDHNVFKQLSQNYPKALIFVRANYTDDLISMFEEGVRVFHLTSSYHGKDANGEFVLDLIRKAHNEFVKSKCRGEVTLVGSGGIVLAEHVAKAMICGLDAVALDTPLLVALQARFNGECVTRQKSQFTLPSSLSVEWGTQRIKNMVAAWCDQMLEILGAMGLREVRRLRGEMGRAMFQKDLEREAFSGISGYEAR